MQILTQAEIDDLVVFALGDIMEKIQSDKRFPEHVPLELYGVALDKAITYRIHQNIGEEAAERYGKPKQTSQRNKYDSPKAGGGSRDGANLFCNECKKTISKKVYDFSNDKYGRPLCMKCQDEE